VKLPEKIRNFSEICLGKIEFFCEITWKKSKFFGNLPWKINFFCEIAWKNRYRIRRPPSDFKPDWRRWTQL